MTAWQPSTRQLQRDAFRRTRTLRSVLIAVVSSAIVLTVLALVVTSSPGWPRVRDSFFDVHRGWQVLPGLLRALWTNLQMMVIAEVFVLIFASLIAYVRTLPGPIFFPVRFLAAAYTDVFRGLPMLLVLFIVGYGIPGLRLKGAPSSPFVLGIIALVLTYTAYVAEVLRAGIESVHPSQRAAARSLGLSYGQTMRHIVFPQAVRRVLPPLLNDFVSLQKDTSLVSILGTVEVVLTAQNDTAQDFKFVPYVVAGLIFVALTVPLTRLTDSIAARQGSAGVRRLWTTPRGAA
ncbi:amino acid ABC transporter permease [Acidothermaceae bacterium B102]|nr:amino acid ABC transporter permease [Acidothermaceae bacterium B102]